MKRGLFLSLFVAAMLLASGVSHGQSATALPDATSAHRRAVSRRRPDRPDRAARRAKTRRAARTIVLRGKRGGRQRCRRRRSGRARGAGRLHDARRHQRFCRRLGDQFEFALRSDQGLCPDHHDVGLALGGGGQSVGTGQKSAGAGRADQSRARQIQLRGDGHRLWSAQRGAPCSSSGCELDSLPRVPFNGAAPAINSTLAGDTPILMMGLPPVAPYLSAEKLRALAVTSATRSQAYPQIPTLAEAGVPNQSSELIIGMVAPAATPPQIVALLQKQIAEIVQLPDFKATLDKLSFQPVGSTSAAIRRPDQERHRGLEQSDEGRQHPGQLSGVSKPVAAHFQPNRQQAKVSSTGYMLGQDVTDADRRDRKTVIDCYC